MTEPAQRVLDQVRGSLGADTLAGAIVYVDWSPIHAGDRISVGGPFFEAPWDAYTVFVDLEPGANWGHACAYLVTRRDADEVIQVAAHMPPFLKAGASNFRLLWRGPLAPAWAVAMNPD